MRHLIFTFVLFISLLTSAFAATNADVTYHGETHALKGNIPETGETAPTVTLTTRDFSRITIGGAKEKVQILATVPSVDSPICSKEIHTFDVAVSKLGHVEMTVVSMDLPFGGQRFCRGYNIENVDLASDFALHDVANRYGVKMVSGKLQGLLARTIFIIDTSGRIVYREIVPSIESEPDYDKIVEIAKKTR